MVAQIYDPKKTPQMVIDYVNSCVDEKEKDVVTEGTTSTSYKLSWKVNLPQVAGVALLVGVSKVTLYNWMELYPEFKEAMDYLYAKQEVLLANNSLSGRYNPLISSTLLARHGYKDINQNQNNFIIVDGAEKNALNLLFGNDNTNDQTENIKQITG